MNMDTATVFHHIAAIRQILSDVVSSEDERRMKHPQINIAEYIANELCDHYAALKKHGLLDLYSNCVAVSDGLRQIDMITGSHGGCDSAFWRDRAVETHPDWRRIAEIARELIPILDGLNPIVSTNVDTPTPAHPPTPDSR